MGDYTTIRNEVQEAYWMDSAERRGDFCILCDCLEDTQTIDCREKDLVMVPKTFNASFAPRVLDLRNNPNLVLLGSGSLDAIADGLEELWLPENMIHLGENSLTNLPALTEVHFEGQDFGNTSIKEGNIISDRDDYFGSVCCGRGKEVSLSFPPEGLTFCDTAFIHSSNAPPGIDSIYLNFTRFIDPTIFKVIYPSSDFMSEAASSAQACAEYCGIQEGCNYFSYDNRLGSAEPICLFLEDKGGGEEIVCCAANNYADENQTEPGWISGRPPSTRHTEDNATVIFAPNYLRASPDNNFEVFFDIMLGAPPLRGAVYVIPTVENANGFNVTISPSKVGLYDANTTAKVRVQLLNIEPGEPSRLLTIANQIESCDAAFTSSGSSCLGLNVIYINVTIPFRVVEQDELTPLSYSAMAFGILVALLIVLTTVLVEKNKEKRAVKYAQIEFLRLLLAGAFLTAVGAVLVGAPPSNGTCIAAIWFVQIGYTLELIPLIVKIAALNRLMAAAAQMRRITLKRRNLFGAVAVILGLIIVFLILWSALETPERKAQVDLSEGVDDYTTETTWYYCSGYYSAFAYIAIGWNTILLLSASVLAFQTSKIKRQDFNESQTLAFLIYSHFVIIVMRLATFFLQDIVHEATLNNIRSFLYSADTLATCVVYFAPKLWRKDDAPGGRGSVMVTTGTRDYTSQPPETHDNSYGQDNNSPPVAPMANGFAAPSAIPEEDSYVVESDRQMEPQP